MSLLRVSFLALPLHACADDDSVLLQMTRATQIGHLAEPMNRLSLGSGPSSCQLPPGGSWVTVTRKHQEPFSMAVYSSNDIVSATLKETHTWESLDAKDFGAPSHAVDIGGNIGFYSFVLANAGWNVTTFEPMPTNIAFFKSTLCANPSFVDRIDLHSFALGDEPGHCELFSDKTNMGDGILNCGHSQALPEGYVIRGDFDVKRLDDVMETSRFAQQRVDFVKIDVEGFECNVIKGAKKLLSHRPRLIQSEVWAAMRGCEPSEYVKMFTDHQYKVKGDALCVHDAAFADQLQQPGKWITDYWFCDISIVPKNGAELQLAASQHKLKMSL